jgi:hypothetical protein
MKTAYTDCLICNLLKMITCFIEYIETAKSAPVALVAHEIYYFVLILILIFLSMRQYLVARFVKIITAKSVRPRMCIQNVGVYSSYI